MLAKADECALWAGCRGAFAQPTHVHAEARAAPARHAAWVPCLCYNCRDHSCMVSQTAARIRGPRASPWLLLFTSPVVLVVLRIA